MLEKLKHKKEVCPTFQGKPLTFSLHQQAALYNILVFILCERSVRKYAASRCFYWIF